MTVLMPSQLLDPKSQPTDTPLPYFDSNSSYVRTQRQPIRQATRTEGAKESNRAERRRSLPRSSLARRRHGSSSETR